MGVCNIPQVQIYNSEIYDDELDITLAESADSLDDDLNYIRSVIRSLHGGDVNWYTFRDGYSIPEIRADIAALGGSVSGLVLSDIGDVTITGPTNGQVLAWNGSAWVNDTLDAAQIPDLDAAKITGGTFSANLIPNLDAGKITTGIFADARISEPSVRQHIGKAYIDGLNVDADTLDGIDSSGFATAGHTHTNMAIGGAANNASAIFAATFRYSSSSSTFDVEQIPTGWTLSRDAVGSYTLYHGTPAEYTVLINTPTLYGTSSQKKVGINHAANFFSITVQNDEAGSPAVDDVRLTCIIFRH